MIDDENDGIELVNRELRRMGQDQTYSKALGMSELWSRKKRRRL